MTVVESIDPRTGAVFETVAEATTPDCLDVTIRAAHTTFPALQVAGRAGRAALMRAMANALQADRNSIIALAQRETALPPARLHGELTRTCYQLRFFADVLDEGGYLEATLDSPAETPMGPRPDLRRMLVPLGVVGVFGASNFPLAFSVPGGDTASALAAGCPVVVKAHSAHPATSLRCAAALRAGAEAAGLPADVVSVVFGHRAGGQLVQHDLVRAVGFTGSLGGGRALLELIGQRPDPIPFYGELSGLNPVVITPSAVADRAETIGAGFADSVTGSSGQLCTKPGLLFAPAGPDGDRLVAAAAKRITDGTPQHVLLTARIAESYSSGTASLQAMPGVRVLAGGRAAAPAVSPLLLETSAVDLDPLLTEECFGPVAVIARYDDTTELDAALAALPASLTATIHGEEPDEIAHLTALLLPAAGRLLYQGFPTGVAVSHAQTHGGPWPSTNSQHTSVGATAIRRFLRPVTWQNAPQHVLPVELRDAEHAVPRRVDGVLRLPGGGG